MILNDKLMIFIKYTLSYSLSYRNKLQKHNDNYNIEW